MFQEYDLIWLFLVKFRIIVRSVFHHIIRICLQASEALKFYKVDLLLNPNPMLPCDLT